MNLSTLFRLEENLQLDKKTLVSLRWIAIIGQLFAINIVYFFLNFKFPILAALLVIFFGLLTNIFLQFKVKNTQIKDLQSSIFLIYDLLQLSILLYLTGGISNPFTILLIVPAIFSSTFLSMGTTLILGFLTLVSLFTLTKYHFPLPGIHESGFTFPKYYLTGFFISIIIGLIFLSYFGIRFAGEAKKRSEALNKLKEVLAKETELESLGGQAAAAAHSLGTPLTTISVIAKELRKDISSSSKHSKDLDLLISQTKRCSEILRQISKKEIIKDKFFNKITFEDLLEEIIKSFSESYITLINLDTSKDYNKISINKIPEIIFGIRNFVGNAAKFANKKVLINLSSNSKNILINITDDGPGFPEDVIDILGEPYIKSKSKNIKKKSGLGLGTFLGKTLLERNGANVDFENKGNLGGASVKINWKVENFNKLIS